MKYTCDRRTTTTRSRRTTTSLRPVPFGRRAVLAHGNYSRGNSCPLLGIVMPTPAAKILLARVRRTLGISSKPWALVTWRNESLRHRRQYRLYSVG